MAQDFERTQQVQYRITDQTSRLTAPAMMFISIYVNKGTSAVTVSVIINSSSTDHFAEDAPFSW